MENFKENFNMYENVKRGDVYWCEFDMHTGAEQYGRRPVIIVSNDKCNEHSPVVTAVPISSERKKKLPTHAIVRTNIACVALCEQIHSVDKTRLGEYMCHLTDNEMNWVEKCLKVQLGIFDFAYRYDAPTENAPTEKSGIKVVSRGYKFFRKRCACCGAVYEYTLDNTEKNKTETICPECDTANEHSSEFGVECVSD